jgi:dienelactone hydrolase
MELKMLEPDDAHRVTAVPVVFYLCNLASPRVGTVDDEILIRELRSSGHLVAIIDYAGHAQARVPFLNRDLAKLRDDVRAKKILSDHSIDQAHVFIVPAGSRLTRDLVFYRDGARALAMDIIAPANPKTPVGAVLEFSCENKDRMGNTSLSICSDTILDGAATEGFAVAMADHPVAAPYKGLDAMPDSAWKIKAAVRTLRAQSAKLGLNGRIVPVGFSRGSGMALMLVTTEGMAEFEGRGEHAASSLSSTVQGAVVMSGRFTYLDLRAEDAMLPRYAKAWGERATALDTWRRHGALDYLTRAAVPLFLTINVTESPDALHQMTVLRARLAMLGSAAAYALDRDPRGHKVTLDPAILTAMHAYLRERLNPSLTPSLP